VAHVVETTAHPNADHLKVCKVDGGHREIRFIVCGAGNVRPGLKTIVALPGAVVPGTSSPLAACVLRGVPSNGMLCSAKELAMEDIWGSGDGLVELPDHTVIGTPLSDFLPKDDWVLHLNVTPNRGDLLSHRGVARELIGLGLGVSKNTIEATEEPGLLSPDGCRLILETQGCHHMTMIRINNIAQKTTPCLIKRRLMEIGTKLHGPCVDITNYTSEDNGQPLHAFDADALDGALRIRSSIAGESFQALDGQTYTLPAGLVVISDDGGILSLAGIMGGMRGRCRMETRNVLLEGACFDPKFIARGGQITHLNSASRSRFERGVDPEFTSIALGQAAQWMAKETGGQVVGYAQVGAPHQPKSISFDVDMVEKRCGIRLGQKTIVDRLKGWGAQVVPSPVTRHDGQNQELSVIPPSWRYDWQDSWDCVNEILRGQGYREIEAKPLPGAPVRRCAQKYTGQSLPSLDYRLVWALRDWWIAQGFYEVVTWSFMSAAKAKPFFQGSPEQWNDLQLVNPMSKDLSVLRPSILPSLNTIAHYHEKYGLSFDPIFEIGPRFSGLLPQDQEESLAVLWPIKKTESWHPENPSAPKEWNFYDVKATIDRCIRAIGLEETSWKPGGPDWYHPGQSARLMQTTENGDRELATIGKLHPGLDCSGFGAELHVNAWNVPVKTPMYTIGSLQPVRKDLSFYCAKEALLGPVLRQLELLPLKELQQVIVMDIFHDERSVPHLDGGSDGAPDRPASQQSITISCVFQPLDSPFSSQDLHRFMHTVAQCAESHGWSLRGSFETLSLMDQ
jgi:phenylalanyl-tRNA synthetase beta chain